jgi:hypothetical protein
MISDLWGMGAEEQSQEPIADPLELFDHSKFATSPAGYHLLKPRNGRRLVRDSVHFPSIVLQ